MVKPAVAAKKGAKTESTVKKTFVPSTCKQKEKLNGKSVVSLLNDYYAQSEKPLIHFKLLDEKSKVAGQNVIDLEKYTAISTVQKQIEGMKTDDFVEHITVPEVHTPVFYLTTYRKGIVTSIKEKAKAEGKTPAEIKAIPITYPVEFKDMVESAGISVPKTFNANEFIESCKQLLASDKLVLKLFNNAFSTPDGTGHKISRIPLQRAPMRMVDLVTKVCDGMTDSALLDEYWEIIVSTILGTKGKAAPVHLVACVADKRIKNAVLEGHELFCKGAPQLKRPETMENTKTKKPVKVDYSAGNREEEIRLSRKCYQEFKKVKNTIDKLHELQKNKKFGELLARFTLLVGKSSEIIDEFSKLKKGNSNLIQVTNFITCVSRLNQFFNEINGTTAEDYIQTIFALLRKFGAFVNLKKTTVRKAILAGEAPAKIAKENTDIYDQITVVKSHDMTDIETYANLGYYLFKHWECTSEVVKVTKPIRASVGLAVFQYIMKEVEHQISTHKKAKTINITLKM